MEDQTKRILIVEDDTDIGRSIKEGLEYHGYEVIGSAVSGEQALSMLERKTPDLILMDIELMGEMDGITTAEEVLKTFKIPVVYLTGMTDDKILDRAKLTDPYGYIVKPFELSELKIAIEIALDKHEKQMKKENTISLLQDSVAEIMFDITSVKNSKPMKGGWLT